MIDFAAYPEYPPYRTLRLTAPHQQGADVYALQTALLAFGIPLPSFGADGDLGRETADGIRVAQARLGVAVDGLAGAATQRALVLKLSTDTTAHYGLPGGLVRGQVEHESSYRVGAYSQPYSNGSYDAGVAQRNTRETAPKDGFEVKPSLDALGERVSRYHRYFGGVADPRRRWALAQGSWNAPAWACWLAKREGATAIPSSELPRTAPGADSIATLEAYIASVSAYLA